MLKLAHWLIHLSFHVDGIIVFQRSRLEISNTKFSIGEKQLNLQKLVLPELLLEKVDIESKYFIMRKV